MSKRKTSAKVQKQLSEQTKTTLSEWSNEYNVDIGLLEKAMVDIWESKYPSDKHGEAKARVVLLRELQTRGADDSESVALLLVGCTAIDDRADFQIKTCVNHTKDSITSWDELEQLLFSPDELEDPDRPKGRSIGIAHYTKRTGARASTDKEVFAYHPTQMNLAEKDWGADKLHFIDVVITGDGAPEIVKVPIVIIDKLKNFGTSENRGYDKPVVSDPFRMYIGMGRIPSISPSDIPVLVGQYQGADKQLLTMGQTIMVRGKTSEIELEDKHGDPVAIGVVTLSSSPVVESEPSDDMDLGSLETMTDYADTINEIAEFLGEGFEFTIEELFEAYEDIDEDGKRTTWANMRFYDKIKNATIRVGRRVIYRRRDEPIATFRNFYSGVFFQETEDEESDNRRIAFLCSDCVPNIDKIDAGDAVRTIEVYNQTNKYDFVNRRSIKDEFEPQAIILAVATTFEKTSYLGSPIR